jgi:type II secretory pathway component PulF
MPKYSYSAYNQTGIKQQGTLEASSLEEARARLTERNLLVAELALFSEVKALALGGSAKLSLKEVEFFTAELALLLKSGLKIDKGLTILRDNVAHAGLNQFIQKVLAKVKQGTALSEALTEDPAFDELYIGLVKIGEETGDLNGVFKKLAEEIKYQVELQNKIKQALVYPGVILTVCILALVFIFNFVIPNLSGMFSAGQQLPAYTVLLLNISGFMQQYQLWLAIFLLLAFGVAWQNRHAPRVQGMLSRGRERLPLVSKANLMVERIRFNSSLATMLSSGVVLDKALKLSLQTLRTASLQVEVKAASEQVKRGQGLAKSLSETRLYPPYFAALLAIGEESGELAVVFQEIADRTRQDFYSWVTRFTNLLEPLLILFMGVVVGSIVVVMMLSITAVTDVAI